MSEEIIDQATFDSLTQLVGEDYIGELVETFFDEAPVLLADMRLALEEGDAEMFRRSAHSLKSNSASFGALQLESLARECEYLGRDGLLEEAEPKLPELEVAYARAAGALKALL
jgi:HPt (histidine-containing phosphotransfer) domain-containing protein